MSPSKVSHRSDAAATSSNSAGSAPSGGPPVLPDGYCPIVATLDLLNSKWALHVVRELMGGRMRFNEIQRRIGSVSPRTLTARLKELEAHGVLRREVRTSIPPWVEYELTEKGRDLNAALECLVVWGGRWMVLEVADCETMRISRNGSD